MLIFIIIFYRIVQIADDSLFSLCANNYIQQ